jgi:hypothetical protein
MSFTEPAASVPLVRSFREEDCEVSPITPESLPAVQRLHQINFPEYSSSPTFSFVISPSSFGYLLYYQSKLVGESTLQWFLSDSGKLCLYLGTFSVVNSHRQLGIGSYFLFVLREKCKASKSIHFHVSLSNKSAIDFFENRGFVRKRTIKDFYAGLPSNDARLYRWKNWEPGPPPTDIVHWLETTSVRGSQILGSWEGQFEVEKIVNKRLRKGDVQYLVKWLGYEELTWESAQNLNCQALVDEFHKLETSEIAHRASQNEKIVAAVKMKGTVKFVCECQKGKREELFGRELAVKYPRAALMFLEKLGMGMTKTKDALKNVDESALKSLE